MFGVHTCTIPNEDEDAEDFEPVRPNLRWGPRSTDEDQHSHIRNVQNVQQTPNQPHQRFQPKHQDKLEQAEHSEHGKNIG